MQIRLNYFVSFFIIFPNALFVQQTQIISQIKKYSMFSIGFLRQLKSGSLIRPEQPTCQSRVHVFSLNVFSV